MFEITETALVHNEGVAQVFIESVRRLGCGVALDDFGTGYGSFRYLKHLPVNVIKLDQEFVRDLDGETSMVNRHVIEATVTLARGMGQKTSPKASKPNGAGDHPRAGRRLRPGVPVRASRPRRPAAPFDPTGDIDRCQTERRKTLTPIRASPHSNKP